MTRSRVGGRAVMGPVTAIILAATALRSAWNGQSMLKGNAP